MSFKGTKGKWRLSTSYGFEVTTSKIGMLESSKSICEISTHLKLTEESHANALLISKAPEMLEMLMILIGDIKQAPVDISKEEKIKMTRKLIKEATEL